MPSPRSAQPPGPSQGQPPGPLASPSPVGVSATSGLSLGVSLAVHGVAVASIVLALRQPSSEFDEGAPQIVSARMESVDTSMFDEPFEEPDLALPIEAPTLPELEPLPPEEFEALTEWGTNPFTETSEPDVPDAPPELDPERILQDPELPREAEPAPESSPDSFVEPVVTPTVTEALPEQVQDSPASPAVVSPRRIPSDCPPPVYPRLAERRGWTGTVVLLIDVAADGSVSKVTIESSSGHDILDEAAVTAVKKWRFHPGTLGGAAAALVVRRPIRFEV